MVSFMCTGSLVVVFTMVAAYICEGPERQRLAQQRVRLRNIRGERPNHYNVRRYWQ